MLETANTSALTHIVYASDDLIQETNDDIHY